jgi:hypothetical protein
MPKAGPNQFGWAISVLAHGRSAGSPAVTTISMGFARLDARGGLRVGGDPLAAAGSAGRAAKGRSF